MKLTLLREFSVQILKKWFLWMFLGLDIIALFAAYFLPSLQPPQVVYWVIAFVGFFLTCLQVYKERIISSLDLEQVGEKISILKTFLTNPSPRSISGIARDTGIDENSVRIKLVELAIVELVREVPRDNHGARWSITTKGRQFLEKLNSFL